VVAPSELRLHDPPPDAPPRPSSGILSDFRLFLLRRPTIATFLRFDSEAQRLDYSQRIQQRLGVNVSDYAILNIHRIGIDCPVGDVFEVLSNWDTDSVWWPNHLATVRRVEGELGHMHVMLFGRGHASAQADRSRRKPGGIPLFEFEALSIVGPEPAALDNARYLLYECRGGYPIGMFAIYVRSPIEDLGEKEQAQLFFVVSFNFYGRRNWSRFNPLNRVWEAIHNRATANIINRLKLLCESRPVA